MKLAINGILMVQYLKLMSSANGRSVLLVLMWSIIEKNNSFQREEKGDLLLLLDSAVNSQGSPY